MTKRLWLNEYESVELAAPDMQVISQELATRQACDYYSYMTMLPDPDIVLRKMGKDIRVYEELLTDPHVGTCFDRRKAGCKKRLWEIDKGKAKSRHAKFITDIFAQKSLAVASIINEILDAPYYGFVPLEVMWTRKNDFLVPERVVGKPPEWFWFSPENKLLLRTKKNWMGEPVPEKKFLIAQNDARYNNPYGRRIASRIFWYAMFKKNGFKWWVTFIEKFGTPYIIGKTPRGSDNSEDKKLLGMLTKMVRDAVAVIPDDSSVELMSVESKGGGTSQHQALLDFCDKAISKAFLGHSAAADSTPGKLGGENVSQGATDDIIDSDSRMVCMVMDQLIDWTIEVNFGPDAARPEFMLYDEENVDSELATRDKTLAETGQIRFTKKYFTKAYQFDDDDIEVLEPVTSVVSRASATDSTSASPVASRASATDSASVTDSAPIVGPGESASAELSAAAPKSFGDQAAVDVFLSQLTEAELEKQLEGDLRPVIELIDGAGTYEEVLDKLADIYPKMDDSDFQKNLNKAMFMADVRGRLATGSVRNNKAKNL